MPSGGSVIPRPAEEPQGPGPGPLRGDVRGLWLTFRPERPGEGGLLSGGGGVGAGRGDGGFQGELFAAGGPQDGRM